MKNLYNKGKGKIHPSPSHQPPSSSSSSTGDALAVLNLLPAAILALTVVLGSDDKEVLAYLITRSLKGTCSVVAGEKPRCVRGGGHQQHQQSGGFAVGSVLHKPHLDCGCFDCYRSFWCRWDSSPDRELIHQAIEAFEEHLSSSEKAVGKSGRRRERAERKKEKKNKQKMNGEEKDGPLERVEIVVAAAKEDVVVSRRSISEVAEVEKLEEEGEDKVVGGGGGCEDGEDLSEEETEVAAQPGSGGERRKSWPDVMGLFNSRLWSLWSPGF